MEDDERRPTYAELGKRAAHLLADMQTGGEILHPVVNTTRKLASHFWGFAWMKHLARCEESGLALAPGRSLLRHGCVLDLELAPGTVHGKVMGERLYDIRIDLTPLDEERMDAIRHACAGKIDSHISLLEGKLDDALLRQLCDPDTGLLPAPEEWRMSCTCPDWSEPCPHAAAAVYAAGTLIDGDPSLLFLLRSVTLDDLVGKAPEIASAEDFDTDSLSRTFGIDLDQL
ncbi:hypothetical protein [Akkermansia glycaniphila]|uniref:SWIM-type domain-containing protein n=1 Tax=Akkermansia glycaniphila TaxID=1679444 RepID=A0A1C7PA48_9BACT|nr:hypothetical protein [Akkermansia glycaniphila]OCA02437.1 hypothetical protein AC781_10490 [Akkermansia glycaniphila]SEI00570.1 Hypothetical protein PYTT_2493 [Akkermansia glycaniphila]